MRFTDRLWHNSAEDARDDFRFIYDAMVDDAERQYSDRGAEDLRFAQLSKVLDGSWDTLDMIIDAIDPLDDERKAMVFQLMKRILCDAETTFKRDKKSNGGVPEEKDRIVNIAIDQEISRCPLEGPVDIGAILIDLEKKGVRRKWLSVYRRIRQRGIDLPTTCKDALSSVGR